MNCYAYIPTGLIDHPTSLENETNTAYKTDIADDMEFIANMNCYITSQ